MNDLIYLVFPTAVEVDFSDVMLQKLLPALLIVCMLVLIKVFSRTEKLQQESSR